MVANGHRILVTARNKEVSHALLNAYQIPFIDRGKGSDSMFGKMLYLIKGNSILLREAIKFKPDLFLSFSSPYAAQVSSLLRKPHIAFDDTEHAKLGQWMYRPFTKKVLSPNSYRGNTSKKQTLFNGYLELCYLHPNHFTPNPSILTDLGVEVGQDFVVLRYVSWNATHDKGHSGISLKNKRKAVKEFSKFARVFISSEKELPEDLQPYQISVSPERIHHVLNYASLIFGESGTMSSEAAMLGTPAIFLNNTGLGYLDNLEKEYGLVFNYTESLEDQGKAIQKGIKLLQNPNLKEEMMTKRNRMLEEKIDVTQYLIKTIEDYFGIDP